MDHHTRRRFNTPRRQLKVAVRELPVMDWQTRAAGGSKEDYNEQLAQEREAAKKEQEGRT